MQRSKVIWRLNCLSASRRSSPSTGLGAPPDERAMIWLGGLINAGSVWSEFDGEQETMNG
jgi:hypothetical protein